MKLAEKLLRRIENGEVVFDNIKFAEELATIAEDHFKESLKEYKVNVEVTEDLIENFEQHYGLDIKRYLKSEIIHKLLQDIPHEHFNLKFYDKGTIEKEIIEAGMSQDSNRLLELQQLDTKKDNLGITQVEGHIKIVANT